MPFRDGLAFEPMRSSEHNMETFQVTDYKSASSYSNLVPSEGDYNDPPIKHIARKRRSFKHRVCFILSLFFGLAWMAPVLYLVIVNILGNPIGAAAWCPSGEQCNVITYYYNTNVTTAARSSHYDEDNHNLLGALQFVVKALEVWWIYIATSFVWLVTVLLAKRPGGLPMGYLFTHMEYTDLRALIDPVLYRSVGGRRASQESRRHNSHLYIFAFSAGLMCLLANLMGPSVAALVLPTLYWKSQPQNVDAQFNELQSASPPTGDNAIPGCTGEQLANLGYSCTTIVYDSTFDSLVRSAVDEVDQNLYNTPQLPGEVSPYQVTNGAVSFEQAIPFSYNVTSNNNVNVSETVWSMSRQVLRSLNNDFQELYTVVLGTTENSTFLDKYAAYNSSLELVLQRQGPMIGSGFYGSFGVNTYTTNVSDDRLIRCYQQWASSSTTKCLRYGTGWNSSNAFNFFTIDKAGAVNMTVVVMVYWSDKAVYVDGNDPCFPNGTLPADANCDYDKIFSGVAPLNVTDQVQDMFVMDYSLPHSTNPAATYAMEYFPFFGFATYSIDVTEIYPSLSLAEVREPPDLTNTRPIVLHPAWMLAAWGIDQGGDVNPNRDAAFITQASVISLLQATDTEREDSWFFWASFYSVAQAASFVTYSTTPASSLDDTTDTVNHPVLWDNVYNKIWGWGIDSRTSKLGIAVSGLGCIVVLARTILLLLTRAKERSSLELIATAIEHQHQGELDHAREEVELGRVRYQLQDDEDEDKLRLLPVR